MMPDEKTKRRIYELRKLLNSVVLPGNLHSDKVLNISRELDDLIMECYSNSRKEQKKSVLQLADQR